MKNIENQKSMTFEEALQDPSLVHIHENLRYLQKTPASQLFPKKYELALTDIVEMEIRDLFQENSNMPIKKVITTIFEPLTDDIPPALMLKLTKKIIDKWAKLLATVQQESLIAVAA